MPLTSQIHVDKPLSNISIKYRNENYIAREVFPELMVKHESDKYYIYDRDFRLPETARADKAKAREDSFALSTSSYVLEEHALKDYVTDRQAQNYDLATLRSDTVEHLTDKILLRMEKSVADLFTSTSWSLNVSLTSAQQFSLNTTTSNPIPIFDTAATTVIDNSGFMPNIGIIPHKAMIAIKNHDSIIDRIKYTNVNITSQMLAGLLDIEKLLVPKAVVDSSAEGVAASIGDVWGDNCFVGYRAQSASPLKPSAGYVFRSSIPMVRRWRDEDIRGEAIEAAMMYQPKVVASLSGYLIKDVLA